MSLDLLCALILLKLRAADDPPETVVPDHQIAELATLLLTTDEGIVTERGEAYIAAVNAVPLPVQRWVVEGVHATAKGIEPSRDLRQHQSGDGSGQAPAPGDSNRNVGRRKKPKAAAASEEK